MWFGYNSAFHVLRKCALYSLFFFCTRLAQQNWRCGYCSWTVATLFDFSTHFQPHQWISCTVHGTYKLHFSSTFSLKMDLTVLFTRLKIILLQCFQFSVFNKISSIQTDLRIQWIFCFFEMGFNLSLNQRSIRVYRFKCNWWNLFHPK